jgi:hypothetical protein
MSAVPRTPRVARAGLVVMDPDSGAVLRVVAFQYNPDTVSRSLQAKAATGDAGDAGEALRLAGPPTQTISLDAELDVTDFLEHPGETPAEQPAEVALGLLPRLAALESLLYPSAAQVLRNDDLARAGTVEVLPIPGPLLVFVWSPERVLPVRLTELSVTEEAFDQDLRPIRAKVSLTLRVLTVDDLGATGQGGSLAMAYHLGVEQLAARTRAGSLEDLGIGGSL